MKNSLFASRIVAALMISCLLSPTAYSGVEKGKFGEGAQTDDDSGELFMKVDTKKDLSINAKGEDDDIVFGLYHYVGKTDARAKKLTKEQRKEGDWVKADGKERKENGGQKWVKRGAVETGTHDPIKENGFTAIQIGDEKYYVAQPKDRDQSISVFNASGNKLSPEEIEKIENEKANGVELTLRETFLPTPGSALAGALYGEYQKRLKTEAIQLPGRVAGEAGPKLAVLEDYANLSDRAIENKCQELDKKLKSPVPYLNAKSPVTLSRISKKEAAATNTDATANENASATQDNPFYPLQNFKDRRYNKPGKLKIRRAVNPKTKKAYDENYIFIHSDKPDESEYEVLDFPVDQATMDKYFPRPKNVAEGADGNRILDSQWTLVDPAKDTLFPRTSEEAFCFFREQAKGVVKVEKGKKQEKIPSTLPVPRADDGTQNRGVNSNEELKDNIGTLNNKIKNAGAPAATLPEAGTACSQAIKSIKSYQAIRSEYQGILNDPWFMKKSAACKGKESGSSVLGEKSAWTAKSVGLLRQMFSNENAEKFLKCSSEPKNSEQVRACTENARFALTWNISTPGQFGRKTQAFIDGFGNGEQSCALFLSLEDKFKQMTSATPMPSEFFRTAFIRKHAKAEYMKLVGPGGVCHAGSAGLVNSAVSKDDATTNGDANADGSQTPTKSGAIKP